MPVKIVSMQYSHSSSEGEELTSIITIIIIRQNERQEILGNWDLIFRTLLTRERRWERGLWGCCRRWEWRLCLFVNCRWRRLTKFEKGKSLLISRIFSRIGSTLRSLCGCKALSDKAYIWQWIIGWKRARKVHFKSPLFSKLSSGS